MTDMMIKESPIIWEGRGMKVTERRMDRLSVYDGKNLLMQTIQIFKRGCAVIAIYVIL